MAGYRPETFKAHFLGKYSLADSENFSLEKAHQLLEVHKARKDIVKQSIKMKVSKNDIHITKGKAFSSVHKQFFTFENIHRFFVFKEDPKLLILGVFELGKKNIILFHFKNEKQTNKVCDLIESVKGRTKVFETVAETDLNDLRAEMRQTGDLETFVVDTSVPVAAAKVSVHENPEPVIEVEDPQYNYIITEELQPANVLLVQTSPPAENGNVRYIDSVIIDDEPKPDYEINEHHKHIDTVVLRTNAPHTLSPSVWEEDVKYITYNPTMGSTVSDTGPIYMYTAHQITPEYRGYSMCTSSSSSSSSSSSDDGETEMTATMHLDEVVQAAGGDDDYGLYGQGSGAMNVNAAANADANASYNGGNDYNIRF